MQKEKYRDQKDLETENLKVKSKKKELKKPKYGLMKEIEEELEEVEV